MTYFKMHHDLFYSKFAVEIWAYLNKVIDEAGQLI